MSSWGPLGTSLCNYKAAHHLVTDAIYLEQCTKQMASGAIYSTAFL